MTGTTQGVAVSYDRPYDSVTGAGQFFARDVAMVWFLERYRYPVSYTTGESVANDPEQLTGHRALIDFGHSEYWSQDEEKAWEQALRRGTSLLFFGSDTLAWRVRFQAATASSSEAGSAGHVIVAYKEHASQDPNTRESHWDLPRSRRPARRVCLPGVHHTAARRARTAHLPLLRMDPGADA